MWKMRDRKGRMEGEENERRDKREEERKGKGIQ